MQESRVRCQPVRAFMHECDECSTSNSVRHQAFLALQDMHSFPKMLSVLKACTRLEYKEQHTATRVASTKGNHRGLMVTVNSHAGGTAASAVTAASTPRCASAPRTCKAGQTQSGCSRHDLGPTLCCARPLSACLHLATVPAYMHILFFIGRQFGSRWTRLQLNMRLLGGAAAECRAITRQKTQWPCNSAFCRARQSLASSAALATTHHTPPTKMQKGCRVSGVHGFMLPTSSARRAPARMAGQGSRAPARPRRRSAVVRLRPAAAADLWTAWLASGTCCPSAQTCRGGWCAGSLPAAR